MPDWKALAAALPLVWKVTSWLGDNPGVLLIAGGLLIVLLTMWKAPGTVAASGDDKVDAIHPLLQIILRLISNGPRMVFSMMALVSFTFGILDLTGTVPLREQRAEQKIQKIEAQGGSVPAKPQGKIKATDLSN